MDDSGSYSPTRRVGKRRNSMPVIAPVFSRQSSIISQRSIHEEDENIDEESRPVKKKFIKSRTDLLILISMALIYFIGGCGFSVMAPFFATEAQKKGVNGTIIGLIFAVYPMVLFVLSPFIGKVLPLVGARYFLFAGCFLEGTTEILFGFVGNMEHSLVFIVFCFLIRAVTAVGTAFSETAILSIVTITFRDNLATVFGILELFSGLGYMAGPALGGVLFQVGGFKLPFIVTGSSILFVLFIVYFMLPRDKDFQEEGTEEGQQTGSILEVARIPGMMILSTVAIVGGMVLSFLEPTLANHLIDITKPNSISSGKVGLIFLIPSVIYTLSAPVIGVLLDKKLNSRLVLLVGCLLCGVSYLFMGPSPFFKPAIEPKLWIVCVSLAFLGMSIGPFLVPVLPSMKESTENAGLPDTMSNTGIVSGIFNGMFSVGSVIGPTLGGTLASKFKFGYASTIFAFALAAEALLLFLFTLWERNSKWSGKNRLKKDESKPYGQLVNC